MSPDFAAISHDLRTPLNAIRTWTGVLDAQLGSSADPIVRKALDGIFRSIDQQAQLLDTLSSRN